jgi:hypothetical protein
MIRREKASLFLDREFRYTEWGKITLFFKVRKTEMNFKGKCYSLNLAQLSNAHIISLDPQLSRQLYNFLPSTFVDNPRNIISFFIRDIEIQRTFIQSLFSQ